MPITVEKIVRTHLKIGGNIREHRERGGSITMLDMPKIILVEHEVLRSLNKRDPRFQAALADSASYFFCVVAHNASFLGLDPLGLVAVRTLDGHPITDWFRPL